LNDGQVTLGWIEQCSNNFTDSLRLTVCRKRCFIDITMAQSVGRSWRAATISALNSKTRLIVGYLKPLSIWVAVLKKKLQELNHIRIVFHSSSLHGNSTQQLCQLFPCRLQSKKSAFVNLRKEVVYTTLWWEKYVDQWNVGDGPTKSRDATQPNFGLTPWSCPTIAIVYDKLARQRNNAETPLYIIREETCQLETSVIIDVIAVRVATQCIMRLHASALACMARVAVDGVSTFHQNHRNTKP